MFKQTKNIDASFRHIKFFTLLLVLGCFILCGFVLYKSYELSAKVQDRIYILSGDKAMEAFASKRKDNIEVEARSHVAMFHTDFFTLDPDEKVIESNIKKALYLADGSAKRQYDNLKETSYYSGIISGNISQQIVVDSISLSMNAEPYLFHCYATIKIIRPNSVVTRNLITQGYLRNVSRSDHNPHGFLIERWETIENRDIKTETR
ncbi:conjugative transposon protein TraK [Ferruginibacter paludis]|uniref:conjugative transposon protein TraK n=1 Tax=Ferruginibacter paludis TaxID=1310417 RepID=UPI0025B4FBBA|nr:conjugative transposon protein TraK [Ferruginibacter paludis]MDN3657799.1 conjugative transposon protein TraK [Ferruginibacter paludis]